MNQLPTELIRDISMLLEPQFRFDFINVNQRNRGTLNYEFMFGSLTLTTLEQVQYFEQHPHLASYVLNLEFPQLFENIVNRRELLWIFPNAISIMVGRPEVQHPNMQWPTDIQVANRAHPQIVHDFRHCDLVRQIVLNQLGDHLTTLYISFDQVMTSGDTMSNFVGIGMPQLVTVHLKQPRFKLPELEQVHRNNPDIQTLILEEARMLPVEQPHHIPTYQPVRLANLSISFHLKTGRNAVRHMHDYIVLKYQHLQHFNYSENWFQENMSLAVAAQWSRYEQLHNIVNGAENPLQ